MQVSSEDVSQLVFVSCLFKCHFLKSFSILKASWLNLLSLPPSSYVSQVVVIQVASGPADPTIYRWNDKLGFTWVQKKKKKEKKTFDYVIILMSINQKSTDNISDKW